MNSVRHTIQKAGKEKKKSLSVPGKKAPAFVGRRGGSLGNPTPTALTPSQLFHEAMLKTLERLSQFESLFADERSLSHALPRRATISGKLT